MLMEIDTEPEPGRKRPRGEEITSNSGSSGQESERTQRRRVVAVETISYLSE